MPSLTFDTPTGPFTLTQENDAIIRASWRPCEHSEETALLLSARDQIRAYFAHEIRDLDIPLDVKGSNFQRAVCAAMSAIPMGETRTYGDLAQALSAPAQAIGQACGGNPIPLIIPCHRVLSATGLGGFSGEGGVETKVQLLKHEGAASLLI